jgi:hypothetical protein
LRRVEGAEAGEEAFEELLQFVRGKNLAAGESLESRKDGILAFYRLNVPATLNVTFLSTNHIENVMRNSRGMIDKVCRWNPKTDQLTRWMGVALLRAQKGFRRVRGHREAGATGHRAGTVRFRRLVAPLLVGSSGPSQRGRAFGACRRDRILLSNVHQSSR